MRPWLFLPAFLAGIVLPGFAQEAPLTLERAEQLALERQPLLEAQRATVRAARERSVAMRQLPTPELIAGVQNLPVNGMDRYSVSADPMTMTTVGLMQEFPLPGKRRLQGEAEGLMADAGDARFAMLERAVRRDTAMAWVDLWFAERAAELARAMATEAARERTAAEIAYRAGRAPQADVLAADVETEMLQDRVRKLEQDAGEFREKLSRWTGEPVTGPVAAGAPSIFEPPSLEALVAALERHPELVEANTEVAAARNAVALARQDYWPDWRVEAMYGWRPEYDEMVTVQVAIDLPVFTGNRQGREVAAAQAALDAHEATHQGHRRELKAMAAAAHRSWAEARSRLARYDEVIVPRANARAEAALAAYRTGKAELMGVIAARRGALDAALMRLDLQMDVLKRLTELRYLTVDGA